MKTPKELNKKKLYTVAQINKKYANKYIEVYPLHTMYWNEKTNKYETVYEVLKVSSTIKENMSLGQDIGTLKAYTR